MTSSSYTIPKIAFGLSILVFIAAIIDVIGAPYILRKIYEKNAVTYIYDPQDMHDHSSDNYYLEREMNMYGMVFRFSLFVLMATGSTICITLLAVTRITQPENFNSIWFWGGSILLIVFFCWFIPHRAMAFMA